MKTSDLPDVEILEAIRGKKLHDLPYHWKLINAKLLKYDRREWIEYGVSMWYPWLTEAGIAKLEELTSDPSRNS